MRLSLMVGSAPSEITIPSRWCPQMSLFSIVGHALSVTISPAPVPSLIRFPLITGRVFGPRTMMTASLWHERSHPSSCIAPAEMSTAHSHPPPTCRSVRLRTVPFIARKLSTGREVDSTIVLSRSPAPMMSTSTAAMFMLSLYVPSAMLMMSPDIAADMAAAIEPYSSDGTCSVEGSRCRLKLRDCAREGSCGGSGSGSSREAASRVVSTLNGACPANPAP
mmetsp:Transcript_43677/g.102717  ORF Transcript_43677/g.102717 Transcript_43677/m.102717 type:complete len:221 (-) Transcript_43677:708-1370(-)